MIHTEETGNLPNPSEENNRNASESDERNPSEGNDPMGSEDMSATLHEEEISEDLLTPSTSYKAAKNKNKRVHNEVDQAFVDYLKEKKELLLHRIIGKCFCLVCCLKLTN